MTKAILVLPGTALVWIPLLIQWFSGGWPFAALSGSGLNRLVAMVIFLPALVLASVTVRLFVGEGKGTPAPWDPPREFVVIGPYRHVRNPMLAAIILMIIAEAIALNSLPLFIWSVVFFALNTIYFVAVEEPALERRFGRDYARYKQKVPRWIPMLHPYRPPNDR